MLCPSRQSAAARREGTHVTQRQNHLRSKPSQGGDSPDQVKEAERSGQVMREHPAAGAPKHRGRGSCRSARRLYKPRDGVGSWELLERCASKVVTHTSLTHVTRRHELCGAIDDHSNTDTQQDLTRDDTPHVATLLVRRVVRWWYGGVIHQRREASGRVPGAQWRPAHPPVHGVSGAGAALPPTAERRGC